MQNKNRTTEKEEVIDKIASFFEKPYNWERLMECWLLYGRSEDLRSLLREALE